MPPASFESDLRAVREGRGTTLDQIQQQTRIPVHVLQRFEEGHLLQDETYNDVYLRAFVKSYAQAVGVAPGEALDAYEAYRAGRYDGRLAPGYQPPASPAEAPLAPDDAAPAAPAPAPPPAAAETTAPAPPAAPSTAPAVEALRQSRATPPPAPPAITPTRAARPPVPGARRSFDKNWGTILGLFVVFVALLGGLLWWLVFRDAERAPVVLDEVPAEDSTAAAAAPAGPRLQLPLRVAVTAAGDGLQNFRVTADADDRRPYWVEAGTTQTFEADSTLILWGEGDEASFSDVTIDLQGVRWTPSSGRPVRLTAATGQALLDSLAAASPAPASSP